MNQKIELINVNYVYGAGTPFESLALDNINLKIETGKITGIIGHTGSGKSTMVRLFNGLLVATLFPSTEKTIANLPARSNVSCAG